MLKLNNLGILGINSRRQLKLFERISNFSTF